MKESKAKLTVCHVMSFRAQATDQVVYCLGSDCMAWQHYESASFKSNAEFTFRRTGERRALDEGYCAKGATPVGDEV